jgi:hypothetical protein
MSLSVFLFYNVIGGLMGLKRLNESIKINLNQN